jgi:hypothetical protein
MDFAGAYGFALPDPFPRWWPVSQFRRVLIPVKVTPAMRD